MDVAGGLLEGDDNASSTNRTDGPPQAGLPAAALVVWTVCPPCILILGTFGNVATIIVMNRIRDDHSSSRAFLMTLAISDLTLLYLILLPEYLDMFFHIRLVTVHPALCKLMNCLSYTCNFMSGWLITSVTIQRTLAVKWPHKIRVMCTLRKTWIIIATIAFAAFVVNFHFLVNMEFSASGNECTYAGYSSFWEFFQTVWMWVDSLTYCIVPFVCIVSCDAVLSAALFRATVSSVMKAGDMSGTNTAHIHTRRRTASRTTVMVLAVSSTFLLLTLPAYLFVIVDYFLKNTWFTLTAAWAVAYNMYYANSAVNFMLYCFTGTKFRTEFLNLVFCRKQDLGSSSKSKNVIKTCT